MLLTLAPRQVRGYRTRHAGREIVRAAGDHDLSLEPLAVHHRAMKELCDC